jgi:Glutamate/Leucine/Phenylalanine/Valine dehydrogenase
MATAIAMSECTIVRVDKEAAIRVLHDEPDLVDQLFNSSEKRLARVLLLLANYERFGLKLDTCCVVIHGFGNVGGMAAKLMSAKGFKIVSIVEYDGAVYNPKGLDIAQHRDETGTINRFSGGEELDKDQAK